MISIPFVVYFYQIFNAFCSLSWRQLLHLFFSLSMPLLCFFFIPAGIERAEVRTRLDWVAHPVRRRRRRHSDRSFSGAFSGRCTYGPKLPPLFHPHQTPEVASAEIETWKWRFHSRCQCGPLNCKPPAKMVIINFFFFIQSIRIVTKLRQDCLGIPVKWLLLVQFTLMTRP